MHAAGMGAVDVSLDARGGAAYVLSGLAGLPRLEAEIACDRDEIVFGQNL